MAVLTTHSAVLEGSFVIANCSIAYTEPLRYQPRPLLELEEGVLAAVA